jgi:hypothetical protein
MQNTSEIELLQKSNTLLGIFCTGGGSELAPLLLSRGGSSSLVDFHSTLYSQQSLEGEIGKVEKFCSEETAFDMAMGALSKIGVYDNESGRTQHRVGVGYTASVTRGPDDREGRTNIAHVAIVSDNKSMTGTFHFNEMDNFEEEIKGDREGQESYIAFVVLKMILEFCNIGENPDTTDVNGVNIETTNNHIFSGSFNPIHAKHVEIVKSIKQPVTLAIALDNVDKGVIDELEVAERMIAIRRVLPTVEVDFHDQPLFTDKSDANPFSTFIVGMDTITRVLDPKYYNDSESEMVDAMLKIIYKNKCSFLIFEREGYEVPKLPEGLEYGFKFIPSDVYSDDGTSSTSIRNAK